MAEIEMEVDMARPLELESHMEDDLIDFDTDMADQREPAFLHVGDDHPPEDLLGSEGIIFDAVHTEHHVEQEADAVMSEEAELGETENTMHDVDEIQNDDNQEVELEFYNAEAYDQDTEQQLQEGEEDYVEIPREVDEATHETNKEQAHHQDDGIDYELEEHPGQHESRDGELEPEAGHDPDPTELANAAEDPAQKDIPQPEDEVTTQETEDAHDEPDQPQDSANEDEITYDEEQDQEPEPERLEELEELEALDESRAQDDETIPIGADDDTRDHNDESQPEDEITGDEDVDDNEDSKEQDTAQEETAENVEFDEYDVSADVGEEHNEEHNDEQEVASEPDHSVSAQGSAAVSDSGFPAITVHYKGDDFPLFSNTSYGFFTETSTLDETMGKLLLSFRAELSSEICDEDELVFQIDELGLEFAESTWRDSLSGVTLRQILEIFELLVKNQDPDDTRTLYTYLFTKPCASKRLEFLIDSATAGKGLDEVIHLFESPITAVSNVPAPVTAAENDNIEHLDGYDSPAEETDESNDNPEDRVQADGGAELNTSPVDDEDAEEGNQLAADEYEEGDDIDQSANDASQPQGEVFDMNAIEELDQTNAHDESEPDPFANLELDNEVNEDEVDLEAYDVDEQSQLNLDTVNLDTANTSTTATLKDDDETGSVIVDVGANITAPELEETTEADHDNEVDEIDWRNQPDGDHGTPILLSPAGKRARGDDDVDAEDEQDAKRRRP